MFRVRFRVVPLKALTTVMFFALSLAGLARSESRRVVDTSHCTKLSNSQRSWLPADWKRLLEYARACRVQNANHKSVVVLISVWAELYYKDQPGNTVNQIEMPAPRLFSPSGDPLGQLPYNFPDDPPAQLTVIFTHWTKGFPERIELFLADPREGGNRSLPSLYWDQKQRRYLPEK